MKKIITLLFIVLLVLCGCTKKEETVEPEVIDTSSLSIVSPTGAPVLAFYNQMENENYTRVSADAIGALWTGDNSPDVIVVDLTSGIKAIENGADYKLGAVLTFGNFYLAGTGNDEDKELNTGDSVVLFGNENMLPNKVWHYLFDEEFDENLVYEGNAQLAAGALASGKSSEGNDVDYVFIAEPALTASLKNNENAYVYMDIQEAYKNKSGLDMIQATLFINNRVSEETGKAFLDELEKSINDGLNNPTLIEEGLSVYSGEEAVTQYGFNPAVVLNVLNRKNALGNNAMGLGFKRAYDIKNEIDAFLNVFGIEDTGEEIYFR